MASLNNRVTSRLSTERDGLRNSDTMVNTIAKCPFFRGFLSIRVNQRVKFRIPSGEVEGFREIGPTQWLTRKGARVFLVETGTKRVPLDMGPAGPAGQNGPVGHQEGPWARQTR